MIATCADGESRASTVEFFQIGIKIYILTEGGKQVENIKRDLYVSIAIYAPFIGWENVKGLQFIGIVAIGRMDSQIFLEGKETYRMRRGLKEAHLPYFRQGDLISNNCLSTIKIKYS